MSHHRPDYSHSIVNLMQALQARHGHGDVDTPYPPLALPGSPANSSLLLVIDGLGHDFLSLRPESFLARHQHSQLSSVFPTTTASAMTSFLTGLAPQQHAITGWFTWFRELGCVTTVLPFNPRFRGASLTQVGVLPGQFVGAASFFDKLSVASHIVYPHYIVESDYTVATSGKAQRHGYENLSELFAILLRLSRRPEKAFIFAYWPHLDGLAHEKGIGSDEVEALFQTLDSSCAEHFPRLAESGLNCYATADHGLIDTDAAHTIHLEDHPELQAMLTLPLCGEPRAAFCYVRAHQREAFEAYVQQHWPHACELHVSTDLLQAGYFGRGLAHRELAHRVGDYTLLMKANYVIKDRIITDKPFRQIGVHGGLSLQELVVPLVSYPA